MTHQCDDPKPRFSNKTGRMFCANCRTYIEVARADASEALRDPRPEEVTDNVADKEDPDYDASAD
jgi:uncharacterized Zn finger protein (UPF0148 family)